jgi:hypothetical protein
VLVNAAVTKEAAPVTFICSEADFISTTLGYNTAKHIEKWKQESFKHEYIISGITCNQLYDLMESQPEFITLDVEGNNLTILAEAMKVFKPECVCVEYDDNLPEIKSILKQCGLNKELLLNGENLIMGR